MSDEQIELSDAPASLDWATPRSTSCRSPLTSTPLASARGGRKAKPTARTILLRSRRLEATLWCAACLGSTADYGRGGMARQCFWLGALAVVTGFGHGGSDLEWRPVGFGCVVRPLAPSLPSLVGDLRSGARPCKTLNLSITF